MNKLKELAKQWFNLVEIEEYNKLKTDFYNYIQEADPLIQEIPELRKENISLQKANNEIYGDYLVLEEQNNELKLKQLKKIEFKVKPAKHKYKPKIEGYMHTILENFSKNTELQNKYWEFLQTLKVDKIKPKDRDNLTYTLMNVLYKWTEKNTKYKTDQANYGSTEYWVTPTEAYNTFVKGDGEGDCEDLSVFYYSCLITAYIKFGFDISNLLMTFIRIGYNYGHMILTYKKNNDRWVKIETTYKPTTFEYDWRNEYYIFNVCYTDIVALFDETTEYVIKN